VRGSSRVSRYMLAGFIIKRDRAARAPLQPSTNCKVVPAVSKQDTTAKHAEYANGYRRGQR
jgi:hypothetical protein